MMVYRGASEVERPLCCPRMMAPAESRKRAAHTSEARLGYRGIWKRSAGIVRNFLMRKNFL